MATPAKLDTNTRFNPDFQSWSDRIWSGRGQRFVEETPRWFERGDRCHG